MTEIRASELWLSSYFASDVLRSGLVKSLSPDGWSAVERAVGVRFEDSTEAVARVLEKSVVVDVTRVGGEEISVWFVKESV